MRQELEGIEFSTQNIEELEVKISNKKLQLEKMAEEISAERKNYAKVLSATILDLALKEFVTFERVQTNNKKEQIIVKVARRDNSELKEDEKEQLSQERQKKKK